MKKILLICIFSLFVFVIQGKIRQINKYKSITKSTRIQHRQNIRHRSNRSQSHRVTPRRPSNYYNNHHYRNNNHYSMRYKKRYRNYYCPTYRYNFNWHYYNTHYLTYFYFNLPGSYYYHQNSYIFRKPLIIYVTNYEFYPDMNCDLITDNLGRIFFYDSSCRINFSINGTLIIYGWKKINGYYIYY